MADVLIRNGTVIDGTGKEPRPNTSVFICGDKIQGLGEEAEIKAKFRDDIRVIDAPGHTVMPGLIDSHTHLTLGEPRSNDELFQHREQNYAAMLAAWNAQKVLRAGVTSCLDADGIFWIGPALKEAIDAGIAEGPRLAVGGFALMTSVGGTAGRTTLNGEGLQPETGVGVRPIEHEPRPKLLLRIGHLVVVQRQLRGLSRQHRPALDEDQLARHALHT